jgi:hypothetical protein
VLHVDDLIQLGPKEIARTLLVTFLRPHPMPPSEGFRESRDGHKGNSKSQETDVQSTVFLLLRLLQKAPVTTKLNGLRFLHGRRIGASAFPEI